jgi:glycosyltransferase involved in cell wall biosynthesis
MRILTVLTYYRPHTSGLTIYAERLAKALAKRGHEVTVLTSQFEPELPREEVVDGVRVLRLPVVLRISKGVIMPALGFHAWREALRHDVLLLHLPQFDAAGIALRGRLLRKPTAIIYHSDLTLPPGLFNRFVNRVVDLMNALSARFAHRIGAYTEDFANHSPYLRRFQRKVRVILPAVELPPTDEKAVQEFAAQHNPEDKSPVIAMATRFAAEKGVDILLRALPHIFEEFPDALVWFAGQYQDVMGEEVYFKRLSPEIDRYREAGRWKYLGVVPMAQMPSFYSNIDVLLVPSTNSTETFGLVQIEAMMNGKPAVASNLPGVRQPTAMTGMGKVFPIGDAQALAASVIDVLKDRQNYRGDPQAIIRQFSPQTNARNFEKLFDEINRELGKGGLLD